MRNCTVLLMVALLLIVHGSVSAGPWPGWRGPMGTGVSPETDLPMTWSTTENVVWRSPLPGPGNSTPIVWGKDVFLTQATDAGSQRSLICFDRKTGETRWKQTVAFEADELTHKTNPYAAASPATDGERVVVWHGSAGMFAYDMDGKELWRRDFGRFTHIWGYASSPVIHGDRVFALLGPGLRVMLVALDKRTGETLWRKDLPDATAKKPSQFLGSWGTPVIREIAGRTELLIGLPHELAAFDVSTGEKLWWCRGLTDLVYTNPLIADDGTVVAMSGYRGAALAVDAGGEAAPPTGDITAARRWLDEKNDQRVGSGVIVDDHIYIVNDPGVMECIDVATGDVRWRERLSFRSWSSMVHADGRLYVIDMRGDTHVLLPSPSKPIVLAKNSLGEMTRASIAVSDGQLFIRTYGHLYCIGK